MRPYKLHTIFTICFTVLVLSLSAQLSEFIVTPNNSSDAVNIKWSTLSEKNKDYFDIERKESGKKYISLGTVKAAGTSKKVNKYNFYDTKPVIGTSTYRLKMVAFDGTMVYSDTITIALGKAPITLTITRNVTSNSYIVDFNIAEMADYMLSIKNGANEEVYKEELKQFSGVYNKEFDLIKYGKSNYTIAIKSSAHQVSKQVVAY